MNPSPNHAPFASAHGRALAVKILLIVGAIVTGISIVVEALSSVFPVADDQELSDNPMGAVITLLMFLVGLVEIITYLTTVVVFLMWLYRAHGNMRAFNPWYRPEYSRGWALGSFFIPFANLIIPYRAVREVWQRSGPPDAAVLSAPGYFSVWWLFWLLAGFASNISFRMTFDENVPETTASIVSIVASVLSIISSVFAYLVVDAIDKRQEDTSGRLRLGEFSGPPPPPAYLSMPDVVAPAPGPSTSEQV